MPHFESPLSSRKFASQPMRDLEVPDESAPSSRPKFSPSVTRRYSGNPMDEKEMAEFQARIDSQMDPDLNLSEVERDIKNAREEKLRAQHTLNDGAKRRIELLIGMTRITREVEIEGNVYVLQTLKGKEMRNAILSASEFDGTVQSPFEIRRQMLARSLYKIGNISIDQFIGSNALNARLDFIDELDDILLNRLMDEYSILTKDAREKYALTTPEQAQELAEDLKK